MEECIIKLSKENIDKLNNGSSYNNESPDEVINYLLWKYFQEKGYYDKSGNKVKNKKRSNY